MSFSQSLSCFSRKRIQFHCIFTATRFEQTLNQSVYALDQFCANRRLWDENPLRSRSFSNLVFIVQVYSSVRIGSYSFEEEKLLCFNICRHRWNEGVFNFRHFCFLVCFAWNFGQQISSKLKMIRELCF